MAMDTYAGLRDRKTVFLLIAFSKISLKWISRKTIINLIIMPVKCGNPALQILN